MSLPQPKRIDWEERNEEKLGQYFAGIPSFDHDAYEQEEIRAHNDGFTASLGSFTTQGDATGFEEAKRVGEAAFRVLVELNNVLSKTEMFDLSRLSPREVEIVEGLRRGVRISGLAAQFGNSRHTVRNHLKHIFKKLGVHSQVELLSKLGGNRA